MGKLMISARNDQLSKNARPFEALLKAWQRGEEVAWADLMAAWVIAPTAPVTKETIQKIIRCLRVA